MGKWMAFNILKKGFSLSVYDIRKKPVTELIKYGANAPQGLAEIGNRCKWIVFSLPDTSVVESVLFGTSGLKASLKSGHIIIDCSTTHPVFAQKAAAEPKREGIIFLDAPISGMASLVREGKLTIMVGGEEEAFQTVQPLLKAMGKTILYMGTSGAGQTTKILNNILFNISCAAMAEILSFAVKVGLDPEKFSSVVQESSGQSYGFDFFFPRIINNNFTDGYPMEKAYKDMDALMELSNKYQIPLPVFSGAMHTYKLALSLGLGDQDKGAMIKVWENIFGVTVRKKI